MVYYNINKQIILYEKSVFQKRMGVAIGEDEKIGKRKTY